MKNKHQTLTWKKKKGKLKRQKKNREIGEDIVGRENLGGKEDRGEIENGLKR